MYYVYVVSVLGRKYVGCTKNISRRRDQHNENARKCKSKFGRFLKENNIVLCDEDFEIVYSSEIRKEALQKEKEITVNYEKSGETLLNDMYTKDCTKKYVRHSERMKEYVIVDMMEHSYVLVQDLHNYCDSHGMNYKNLQRTAKGNHVYAERYKAFLAEDWESTDNKDVYLSGSIIGIIKKNMIQSHVDVNVKKYIVKFPDGSTELVTNLEKFAREHNLTSGTLHATYTKNRPTKGYQVIWRI